MLYNTSCRTNESKNDRISNELSTTTDTLGSRDACIIQSVETLLLILGRGFWRLGSGFEQHGRQTTCVPGLPTRGK